jgi:hypothetical protein
MLPWSLDAATKIKSEPVQPDRHNFNDERGLPGSNLRNAFP